MQAIAAMPVKHSNVNAKLDGAANGIKSKINANALQTTIRTPLSGLKWSDFKVLLIARSHDAFGPDHQHHHQQ